MKLFLEGMVAFGIGFTGSLLIAQVLDQRAWITATYAGLVALGAYLKVPRKGNE